MNPELSSFRESNAQSGMRIDLSDVDVPIALRKGIRSCTQHPISNFVGYDHLSQSVKALVTHLSDIEVPITIQEALKDAKWRGSVLEKMNALEKNGTWEIVTKPTDKSAVGCKWVFAYKADDSIECYKARLVVKRYT